MSYSQTFLLFRARGVVYLGSVFRGRAFTSSQLLQDTLLGTHNLLYTCLTPVHALWREAELEMLQQ